MRLREQQKESELLVRTLGDRVSRFEREQEQSSLDQTTLASEAQSARSENA